MRALIAIAAAVLAAALGAATPALAYHERPMLLPAGPTGPAAAAAARQPATWLVGARPASAAAARIARGFGAQAFGLDGAYRVATARARRMAAVLRHAGTLTYAEPDAPMHRASAFDALPFDYARGLVVPPGLAPPAPGEATIAIVDDFIDPANPDVGAQTQYLNGPPNVLGPHGTEVASVAAGAYQGAGVVGIFPSAKLLSYGVPTDITCSEAAAGIVAAAENHARVINLSLGSDSDCFTLFRAVELAYASGSLVVAAGGNEFEQGNPVIYPAAYPHVLSVAALDKDLQSPDFSSESTAIDIAAPGVDVPASLPVAFDTDDGTPDGLALVSGTSFAAPMVAGAAAWLATVRPDLSNGQIADILRRTAKDVARPGYDAATGFGLVQMAPALAFPTPKKDILEPNDGITFVDGTAFRRPDPYVWRGNGVHTLSGSVDRVEDPFDVYRIRVPAKAAFKILLRPNFGNPDLTVFNRSASTIDDTAAIIGRSHRAARRTDVVRLVNNSGDARTAFVLVDVAAGTTDALNASYRLQFVREKRP